MPTFGRYETVKELHRTGLTVVWSARAVGGGETGGGFVVKELRASADLMGEEGAARARDAFVARAKAQQRASEGEGSAWAPVLDVGTTDEGAYYVTRHYARTAQRMVAGRVKLDGGALWAVTGSVVAGLRRLRTTCVRSHGNLKPSNVLVEGGGEEPVARAVLTDPAEASEAGSAADDLRGLGELIHQLVLHQGMRRGGWPLADSPEWARLGPTGAKWRDFCNRLLDPALSQKVPTLEEIEELLPSLRPPEKKKRPVALIAGIAAVLVIGLGLGGYFLLRGDAGPRAEDYPYVEAKWAELCSAHNDWLDGLAHSLDTSTPRGQQLRARMTAVPALAQTVALLDEYSAKMTPQVIAKSKEYADALRRAAPDSAKKPAAVKATGEALDRVEQLKKRLKADGLGEWAEFKKLRDVAEACGKRGWTGPAEYLKGLAGAVTPSDNVGDSLARIMDAGALVQGLEKLSADVDRISATDDKVVSQLSAAATAVLSKPKESAEINQALESVRDVTGRLSAALTGDWAAKVDRDLIVTRPVYTEAGDPSLPRLITWVTEVQDTKNHVPGEADPRDLKWPEGVVAIRKDITDLTTKHGVPPEEGPKQFEDQLTGIEKQIDGIKGLRWNRTNQGEITQKAGVIASGLATLRQDVKGATDTQLGSLEEFKQSLKARADLVAADSPAINEEWRKRRDELLATETDGVRVKTASKRLQRFLSDLDKEVPRATPGTGRAWEAELAKADQKKRDAALRAVLATVTWDKGAPPAPGTFRTPAAPVDQLKQWRTDVASLAADAAALEDRMDALYRPAEAPEGGGKSATDLAAACRGRAVMAENDVSAALTPVTNRYAALEAIGKETDRAKLLTAAADTRAPALALAAWRRMGDSGVQWPALEQSLRDESRVEGILRGVAGAAPESRRAALADELTSEGKRRWAAHVARAADVREIRAALLMMPDFKADEGLLDTRGKLNLRVVELERLSTDKTLDETALKGRLEGSLGEIKSLSLAGAGGLIDELGKLTSAPEVPKVDVATLGPATVGWAGAADADGSHVRFTKGAMTLDFVRVDPKGAPTAYLCTTEASFEVAQAAVTDAGLIAAESEALYQYSVNDPRQGPRVWRRGTAGRVVLDSAAWLAGNPKVAPRPEQVAPGRVAPYPTDLKAGRPEAKSPVQWVSPAAAVVMSRAAGCRLPTSGEWSAALEKELAGATLDSYVAAQKPNLRDQTWAKQKAYRDTLQVSADDAVFVMPAIDPAAGSFWTADGAGENYDDGVLWFTAVDTGPGTVFKNLIGNVGEMVYDDPAALDALQTTGLSASAAGVATGKPGLLGVAGFSALAARDGQAIRQASAGGWLGNSDVGVRLAFSATNAGPRVDPLAVRLAKVLATSRYLAPGQ